MSEIFYAIFATKGRAFDFLKSNSHLDHQLRVLHSKCDFFFVGELQTPEATPHSSMTFKIRVLCASLHIRISFSFSHSFHFLLFLFLIICLRLLKYQTTFFFFSKKEMKNKQESYT